MLHCPREDKEEEEADSGETETETERVSRPGDSYLDIEPVI